MTLCSAYPGYIDASAGRLAPTPTLSQNNPTSNILFVRISGGDPVPPATNQTDRWALALP